MCPLRRVEDCRAGPAALGILVPPGRRTFLIVRPRSLVWDLLLLRPDSATAFRELYREQAGRIAEAVYAELDAWPNGSGRIEDVPCPDGGGFWLHVRAGSFVLALCGRKAGQPYEPLIFPNGDEARAAAVLLRGVLCPPAGVEQEVYLNSLHFTR